MNLFMNPRISGKVKQQTKKVSLTGLIKNKAIFLEYLLAKFYFQNQI